MHTSHRLTVLMAVPLYPPPVVGGLEKQAHELAVELAARGHRLLAVSGRHFAGPTMVENVDGVEVQRIGEAADSPRRWLARPLATWACLHRLARKADIVHVHVFSGFGLFFIALARLYGKPVLVKLPNVGDDGLPGLGRQRLGRLRLWLFGRADAVVAMTTDSLRELDAIRFPRGRVLTTPNGIRLIPASPIATSSAGDLCRMVLVGRLHEQKGIPDLLAALGILPPPAAGARWRLDLVGDGPLREDIERRIAVMGLQDRVRVLGHLKDVSRALADSDVFVLPSHREGNSNAILEAMCAGLPVVSTTVGGTPMLVGPAGAPLLHAPGDIQGLADRLTRMITRPALRRRMGDAMRQRVECHFDIQVVASTYERAYETLFRRRRDDVSRASNPVVLSEI
jgi:glycosyltransferase involved in cell wall biosynthesis